MKIRFFILFLIATTVVRATPPVEDGKAIFTARCASCHNVNKVIVGPALGGVDKRHSIEWIVNFVHSSQTVIKGGDKAATELFDKFNHIQMPDHPDLTADNIKNVVEYIKSESSSTASAAKAPFAKPTKLQTAYKPLSLHDDYGFFLAYLVIVALLIVGLLFFVQVKAIERNMHSEKNS